MNIRHFLTLALFALAAFACDSARAAQDEIPLVRDGRSAFVIVHAADAPGSVRTAARELQSHVEKVTAAKLPIVAGDAPAQGAFVALGDTTAARAAGICAAEVTLGGFRIASRGGILFIVGNDTRDGDATPRYQHDVLAANYARIEALYLEAKRAAESWIFPKVGRPRFARSQARRPENRRPPPQVSFPRPGHSADPGG